MPYKLIKSKQHSYNLIKKRKRRRRRLLLRWRRYNPSKRLSLFLIKKKKSFFYRSFLIFQNTNPVFIKKNKILNFIFSLKPFYFTNIFTLKNDCVIAFQWLFQNYFFKIFNYFFSFKSINLSILFSIKLLDYSLDLLKKLTPKRLKIYYFTELSEILLSTGFTKNLLFLTRWYKKLVEKHGLRLFSLARKYFRNIFYRFFLNLHYVLNIKGFFIKFKGKFLKGGGKKKKIIYNYGEFSSTNKNLRLVYKKLNIRTISGIVGLVLKISY